MPSFGVANGLAAVRAGEADLYFASEHDNLEAHRGLAYFAGLPGDRGLNPQHLQTWIGLGGGQALWDELAADLGIKPMLAAHTGSRSYLLATERIDAMSALAGRKAHVQGLARDVARGLGLEPVSVAPAQLADVHAAAATFSRPNAAAPSPATRLVCTPSLRTGPGPASTATARRCRSASAGRSGIASVTADQAMLAAAASAEFQLSLAEEEAHRQMLYPEPAGRRTWPLASELSHAIRRVADAVVAHAAGADAQTRRINDSYAAFRRSAGRGRRPCLTRVNFRRFRLCNVRWLSTRHGVYSGAFETVGRRHAAGGIQTDTGLFLFPMNMTSMPSLADAGQHEPTDDQMQQIRRCRR